MSNPTFPMLLQCLCGHRFTLFIEDLSNWLGGPQVQCPQCNGHNDAVNFLLKGEHQLVETAVKDIVPSPLPALVDPIIEHVIEKVADPIVEELATLIPEATTYDGTGDGAPAVPVADQPTPAPATEPVDPAQEVSNSG